MSATLIIFIIIHIFTLFYFVEALRRISRRMREYPLEDNRETVPFGFIRLNYIIVLYILAYIGWIAFSIWLYIIFTQNPSLLQPGVTSETMLNL